MSDEQIIGYIGNCVVETEVTDEESKLVKVTLDNKRELQFTQDQYKEVLSTEPYHDGQISVKKWTPAITQILQILLENNLTLNDKEFVLDRIAESILTNHRAAICKLYNVSDIEDVSMKMIDDILKK